MDFEDFLDGDAQNEAGEQDMFMFGLNSQEEKELKDYRDSVIFLIDCHESMHLENGHN